MNHDLEQGEPGQIPGGWLIPKVLADQGFSAVLTAKDPQSGKYCAEIRWPADGNATVPFSNLMQVIDATAWRGKRIKVTASIRVASGRNDKRAQMWLRVDRPTDIGAFDNMYDRPVRSQNWADYSIIAEIHDDAKKINLGLISFEGETAWWDNVRVEVLGEFKTLAEPPRPLSETGLNNLIAFTRLVGYVRHFHPSDQAAFNPIAPTVRVFEKGKEPAVPSELQPPTGVSELKVRFWEHFGYCSAEKSMRAGPYNSRRLTLIAEDPNSLPDYALPEYVYESDLGSGVSCIVPTALFADDNGTIPPANAVENEDPRFTTDHRGARLATVMTTWNILQHFYPYFDVIDADWPHELEVALRKAAIDPNEAEFYQTLNRLVVALQDGHGSLNGPGMPPAAYSRVDGKSGGDRYGSCRYQRPASG